VERERVKPVRINEFSHQKILRASIPLVASGERCWYWDRSIDRFSQASEVKTKSLIAIVRVKRAEMVE
jgi:hypothetical protein